MNPDVYTIKVTKDDIIQNPYNLEFVEVDLLNIPRSVDDFDYVVITGSVIFASGIDSSTALLQEDIADHLLLQVVVKEKDKDTKRT